MQDGIFYSSKYEANVGGIRGLRQAMQPSSEVMTKATTARHRHLLRVEVEMGSIDLIKPPE